MPQAKQSTPNTHSAQALAQLLPALFELTQLGLQHLSTLAITKKHAAATNFTPEQAKIWWDRQPLIIDGWRRLDTKDAEKLEKRNRRSKLVPNDKKVRYVMYFPQYHLLRQLKLSMQKMVESQKIDSTEVSDHATTGSQPAMWRQQFAQRCLSETLRRQKARVHQHVNKTLLFFFARGTAVCALSTSQ